MKSTLRKFDEVLTADERFRLALAAMARDDEAEVQRLHTTCPRFTYMMADNAFGDLWHESWDVTMKFMVSWLWSHKQFSEAMWALAVFDRVAARGITTLTKDELFEGVFARRAELKATYVGLLRFCEAARLDWRTLLMWWPPILDEIESVRYVLDDETVEIPDEMADVVYRFMASTWPVPLPITDRGANAK